MDNVFRALSCSGYPVLFTSERRQTSLGFFFGNDSVRVGNLHYIFEPHRGAFAAFPKQNDKCPGERGGGGWARLELTEP